MKHSLAVSTRLTRAAAAAAKISEFVESSISRQADDPAASNFLFGNPQELPIPAFSDALRHWAEPKHKDWFAYQTYQRPAQEAVAAGLRARYALEFAPDDVLLTTGAFGGLSMLLTTLIEDGDEAIFFSPPWFFYESMILLAGGSPVRLRLEPPRFDLDLEAVARAITPRTKAIIVNSAQNPTGRVYDAGTLRALADLLERSSARFGQPIYLFSDEAYSHIVFEGCRFETPTAFYPFSFLIYTYGKVLLTPGQRLGYVALPPSLPDRAALRPLFLATQMIQGWTFPNAVMQYVLPELEKLSIDVRQLQRRRDRLAGALRTMGYELAVPESTFYLLPKSPVPDDRRFCDRLADEGVLCMPASVFDLPGYFRISITASDGMIDRALPGFERALERATGDVA
jgi:aspartate aminotransferase